MGMTKAQVEAWLEGWRMVEAARREEALPSPAACLAQVLPLCDLMRERLPWGQRPPADEENVREVWARLTRAQLNG